MQPLALTSNFSSGYSSNRLSQISLEFDPDSPDNKSNSDSPKQTATTNKSVDQDDSPVCELTSQHKNSVLNQTIQYLNVVSSNSNPSKISDSNQHNSVNKMSKTNQHCSTNNENNINRHNINNNLSARVDSSTDKQHITPIVRFRRLLTSIYHHANDISAETGEQVHALILGLINSTCSVDDFQIKIQELINYPLRSHIINFIRNCLSSIRNEIAQLARLSKQNIIQFVKQNESLFLDVNPNSTLVGLNMLVDLDEMLLSNSITTQQLKRRYSPDFLLDNENQFNTNKRFHLLNTASPIIKLNNSATYQNGQKSANQSSISQQSSSSKTSVMNGNAAVLTNSSVLQNHLVQARTAMIEELMSNRFYQTPIQQQFNIINQHLNQQIHGGHKSSKQQPQSNLSHINGFSNAITQMSNQINNNQINGHLQTNVLLNSQLKKQQLERIAVLERYDKEIAQQNRQPNANNLRSNLESNMMNSNNRLNSTNTHSHQKNQLINSFNLNTSIAQHQLNKKLSNSINQQSSNEMNNEEEWRAIDTMLNCIINMVEKTKRALNVLQQKSQDNLIQQSEQLNSPIDYQQRVKMVKTMPIIKNPIIHSTNSTTPPLTTLDNDYLDLRKSKDQLFSSLNINVNPVPKIPLNRVNAQTDLMSIEKCKIEQIFNTISRKTTQNHISNIHEENQENCWNCGRKANETCSGCNEAKYCGPFCQHKDWETHHAICTKRSSADDQINEMNNNFKLNNVIANSPNFCNGHITVDDENKDHVNDPICADSSNDETLIEKNPKEGSANIVSTDENSTNEKSKNDELKEKKIEIKKDESLQSESIDLEITSHNDTKESTN